MLLELKQIQETKPIREITDFDLDDLIFLCICNHLDTGHENLIGSCHYETCDCKNFKQKDFEIEIILTVLDVFSYENPELEYDSPQFWLELKFWLKEYNENK